MLDRAAYYFAPQAARRYDISADGQRLLLPKNAVNVAANGASEAPRIVIVTNWTQELERLVPTN